MLNLVNLDAETRRHMLDELDADISAGKLYFSTRLNDHGRKRYPELLREAMQSHDDTWLADNLREEGCFKEIETRHTKRGVVNASVPVTAPETLAEGEFNRFYARALCRVAMAGNIASLVIYRAKEVMNPRSESEVMIGTKVESASLLDDLRTHQGIDTALRLPPGPNSGLSVRLPS